MAEIVDTGPWPSLQRQGSENLLDSLKNATYKVSLWQPTVEGLTSAGSATYTIRGGILVEIGPLVFYQFQVSWTGHTGTGSMIVTGLPLTVQPYVQYLGTTYEYGSYIGSARITDHAGVAADDMCVTNMSYAVSTLPRIFFNDNSASNIAIDAAATIHGEGFFVRKGYLS